MVKMMQCLLFLAAVTAGHAGHSQAKCALDGAAAADGIANTGISTWAASERCGNPKFSQLKCTIDIMTAVQSVIDVFATITNAVNDCGEYHTANANCGGAVAGLTSAAAGLTAASAGIVDACPSPVHQDDPGFDPTRETQTNLGKCVMDAKSATKSLFVAAAKLSHVQNNCEEKGRKCAHNALTIVSVFADLGSFLAAAVNDCSSFRGDGNGKADCAANVLGLVSALQGIADAGINVNKKCGGGGDLRLYLDEVNDEDVTSSSMPLLLAALLPISAVLSFVTGLRFAKGRSQEARELPQEAEE